MIESCNNISGILITLAPVSLQDSQVLLNMRNAESVRCNFPSDSLITESEHSKWIKKVLNTPYRAQWLIKAKTISTTVGSVWLEEIDLANSHAEFGFYLSDTSQRNNGVSLEAEYRVLEYAFETLGINKVYCETLGSNLKVSRMHSRLGFLTDGIFRQHVSRNNSRYDLVHQSLVRNEFYSKTRPRILPILERFSSP